MSSNLKHLNSIILNTLLSTAIAVNGSCAFNSTNSNNDNNSNSKSNTIELSKKNDLETTIQNESNIKKNNWYFVDNTIRYDFNNKNHEEYSRADSLRNNLDGEYYFNDFDLKQYNSWVDSTLNESKNNNSVCILVDKSEYKLYVYDNGIKINEFPIELGADPISRKIMEGDMATPEGMYGISKKLPLGVTSFHKSMHYDYPSVEDVERFNEFKMQGVIPNDATIGSLLAIHGKGSGFAGNANGWNWTHGCVALSNKDMDVLYDLIPMKTRVTIVKYTSKKL